MRNKLLPLVFSLLPLISNSALAESDFDFEELMKSVETKIQNVQNNISAKDANTAGSESKELQDAFKLVEGFFEKRGNSADAVEDAKNYQNQAISIQKALTASDFDTAANAASDFSKGCRGACHDKYKPL
jgi:hypothetical protein